MRPEWCLKYRHSFLQAFSVYRESKISVSFCPETVSLPLYNFFSTNKLSGKSEYQSATLPGFPGTPNIALFLAGCRA
jgi:hypothetical protein